MNAKHTIKAGKSRMRQWEQCYNHYPVWNGKRLVVRAAIVSVRCTHA